MQTIVYAYACFPSACQRRIALQFITVMIYSLHKHKKRISGWWITVWFSFGMQIIVYVYAYFPGACQRRIALQFITMVNLWSTQRHSLLPPPQKKILLVPKELKLPDFFFTSSKYASKVLKHFTINFFLKLVCIISLVRQQNHPNKRLVRDYDDWLMHLLQPHY